MMRTLLVFIGCVVGLALAAPIVVAGFPFWCLSWCTRTIQGWIEPQTVQWKDLIQFDPIVGWRPKPSMRIFCDAAGADVFYVETDDEGWCGSAPLNDSSLVVFGDSYAFGYAVNQPFFRASKSGLRVKAIAAPGYSMVQELVLMMQLAPRLRGKQVVWFVYPGNDLTDNLCPCMQGYRTPFLRESTDQAGWEIVSSHLQADKWAAQPRYDWNKKVSAVFGRNRASDRVYAACEFLIARGQMACKQSGANLVVLTIPWTIQFDRLPWPGNNDTTVEPDLPERMLGQICTRLGVSFVAGSRHLSKRHYIPHEGHLNEEGHRRLAKVLDDLYRNQTSCVRDATWSQSIPVLEEARQ